MKKYEYRTASRATSEGCEVDFLNSIGGQGWKLIRTEKRENGGMVHKGRLDEMGFGDVKEYLFIREKEA